MSKFTALVTGVLLTCGATLTIVAISGNGSLTQTPAPKARPVAWRTTRNSPPAGTSGMACGASRKTNPDSDLYAESSDVDTVISYITGHSIVDR